MHFITKIVDKVLNNCPVSLILCKNEKWLPTLSTVPGSYSASDLRAFSLDFDLSSLSLSGDFFLEDFPEPFRLSSLLSLYEMLNNLLIQHDYNQLFKLLQFRGGLSKLK